jgi:DNA-damage-inducible protein D
VNELTTPVSAFEHFEECGKQNGVRYWEAHELMARLGYTNYSSFANVMNKAISSCAQLGIQIVDAFIQTSVVVSGKAVSTYRLARFACFLTTMQC